MSGDPTGGPAANAAPARMTGIASRRGEGRQPRRTAHNPPATPAAPIAIAAHNVTVTKTSVGCAERNTGGQPGRSNDGTAAEGPRTPTTAMSATLTKTAATQARPVSEPARAGTAA